MERWLELPEIVIKHLAISYCFSFDIKALFKPQFLGGYL